MIKKIKSYIRKQTLLRRSNKVCKGKFRNAKGIKRKKIKAFFVNLKDKIENYIVRAILVDGPRGELSQEDYEELLQMIDDFDKEEKQNNKKKC